jgi:tetratricopeptide (TPR) repeat protein
MDPWRSAGALLLLTACSAGPARDADGPPTVILPVATSAASTDDASSFASSLRAPSPCTNGVSGPRCDGLVDAVELRSLPAAIHAAHEAMLAAQFSDVRGIARLAHLQLRRDGPEGDADGANDAARGLHNGQRAVAVDDTSAVARLTLVLAIARSIQTTRGSADPTLRGLGMSLVETALGAVPPAPGAVGAATRAFTGYLALERGDQAFAKASFEGATRLDPGLGTAWVGLGDVARITGDFAAATSAYQRAAAILPRDVGVARSLAAAGRRERMALPVATAPSGMAIAPGPLAPPPPPPGTLQCSASQAVVPTGATLCQGLARLGSASSRSRDDQDQAAKLIMDGWREMAPLCDAGDPACGPLVVQAMAVASRAFQGAGRVAKAIAAAKLVIEHAAWPGGSVLVPEVTLEIADRYFALGVFAMAADWYARYLQLAGTGVDPVAERALQLRVALEDVDAAKSLANLLAADARYAASQRSRWLLLTGALVRALGGAEAAEGWLQTHHALLAQAGATQQVQDVSTPLPRAPGPSSGCAAPLSCAVRRLVGETW